jgi:hypothetical protein
MGSKDNKYREFDIVRNGKLCIPKVIRADIGYCLMFGHNQPRESWNSEPLANSYDWDYEVGEQLRQNEANDFPRPLSDYETPGE